MLMREKEPKVNQSQSQVEGNQPDYRQRYNKLVLHLVEVEPSVKLHHRRAKSKRSSLEVRGRRGVGRHRIHLWTREVRNWKQAQKLKQEMILAKMQRVKMEWKKRQSCKVRQGTR